MLGVKLAHIVVERVVLCLGLLEAFHDLLQGAVHTDGFLDGCKSLLVLLDFLHGNVNGAGVTGNGPGSSGGCAAELISVCVNLSILIDARLSGLLPLALGGILLILVFFARFSDRRGLILYGHQFYGLILLLPVYDRGLILFLE